MSLTSCNGRNWRQVPVAELPLSRRTVRFLEMAGLTTIGELSDFASVDPEMFAASLARLGLGPLMAGEVEQALEHYLDGLVVEFAGVQEVGHG